MNLKLMMLLTACAALFFACGGIVLASSTSFTAYNDCSLATGESTTAITSYTAGGGGNLKDYATNTFVPVTMTISGTGITNGTTIGSLSAAGTDGYRVFNGKVGPVGVLYGQPPTTMSVDLSGLDVTQQYEVVFFANRVGAPSARHTTVTVSGVNSFTNASTPGADFAGPTDPQVTILCADTTADGTANTATGYVSRFTNIAPAPSGTAAFTFSSLDATDGYFYLAEVMVKTPPTPQVAAPACSPNGGPIVNSTPISLASATSGATIRYTLDGSTPTESHGAVYSGPFTLAASATVTAFAALTSTGMVDSSLVSAAFVVNALPTVAAPTISPNSGMYYNSVQVTLAATTGGASINYTTNGSTPTSSAGTLYTGPFTLYSGATVNAIGFESGFLDSAVTSAVFTITTVAPTSIGVRFQGTSPNAIAANAVAGVVPQANWNNETASTQTIPVALTDNTGVVSSATTAWSADHNSAQVSPYSDLDANYVLMDGYLSESGNAQTKITVTIANLPTFLTDAGYSVIVYANRQDFPYTCDYTLGATTIVLADEAIYAGTFVQASAGSSGNYVRFDGLSDATFTLSAVGDGTGLKAPVNAIQIIEAGTVSTVAAPAIMPNGGSFTHFVQVTLTTTTVGASINYTTDGSLPTETTGTLYAGPFTLTSSATINAIAYESGMTDSAITSATFTIVTGTSTYGMDTLGALGPYLNNVFPPSAYDTMPATLSAAGVFSDLTNLVPTAGLLPYGHNALSFTAGNTYELFWAGLATGTAVTFAPTGEWAWPDGTVFVREIELGTDDTNPAVRQRLETRVMVRTGGYTYGVTYKWRADNSDADLVDWLGESDTITIQTAGGGTRTQTWNYPSRSDCLTCHTQVADTTGTVLTTGVLGVKTRQLNGYFTYPSGVTDNQLRTWNHLNLFSTPLDEASISGFAKLSAVGDTTATLEQRSRSYLDSNCFGCHLPNGPYSSYWDARYDTPLANQGIVNGLAVSNLSITGAHVVTPGSPSTSVLYVRLNLAPPSDPYNLEMPPTAPTLNYPAREMIDSTAVQTISAWIMSLPASIAVAPASAAVGLNGTQQFKATALDGNGNPLAVQPAFAWSVTGAGSIDAASGLYTAGTPLGGATVTASAEAVSGTASVYPRLSITSPATAVPAMVGVGQTVNFTVQVSGAEGPLAYIWAFGDGTPLATDASPSHAYVTAGAENADVTVSDGYTTVTSSVTVTVAAPLIGTGDDSDGDGFSDSFETAAGSNPNDANSTPFGTAPASITGPFSITALALKLNFVKQHSDSLALSGRVPVAAGTTMLGETVVVSAGDYVGVFAVNSKGKSPKGHITLSVAKPKNGVANFALKASHADLVAAFASAGMTATAPKALSVNLPCIILYPLFNGGVAYSQTQGLSFTQTKGKTGATKLVK